MIDRFRSAFADIALKLREKHGLDVWRGLVIGFLVIAQLWGGVSMVSAATPISFTGEELLGKPTDTSVTVSIIPNSQIEYHYQFGTAPGDYSGQTANAIAAAGNPHEMEIGGLVPNTQYYYRMRYHLVGEADWVERAEHSFWTQRAQGSTFTFSITSDSHVNIMLGNAATWTATLNNVVEDHPDFVIDLGDTFAMDSVTTATGAEDAYEIQRQFFDIVGNSSSIYVMPGNHEQTEGWHRDDRGDPADSLPTFSINAMKKFYVNPIPNDFYTGNEETFDYISGDNLLEDYYAWTWGDALFVVIDPYWYTTTKPYTGDMGGGESSETGSGDRWDWTLGYEQFMWLKGVLENSNAAYKFVFAHHMVGGSEAYVRGGAVPAHMFEWGGYNADGTTWGFDTQRPGWGDKPVHQIFIDTGVSAFFHGHDHQYAYEVRDGIVYQSMPAAGFNGGFSYYSESDPYTERVLPSPGHLQVIVSSTETTVTYIDSSTTSTKHSYTIAPNEVEVGVLGDVNGDGNADSVDALAVLSGDAGIDAAPYCPMNCGDVNGDNNVDSTDAMIILTYNAGLSVAFPVGEAGCPSNVNPCQGCLP